MKGHYIILMSLVCMQMVCHGQGPYSSRKGKFTVPEKRGCAPFTVNVTIADVTLCAGNNCQLDFEGTGVLEPVLSHTYNQPGTYSIILVPPGGTTNWDTLQVEVFANIQPAFDIYACSNYDAFIRITDNNYDQYAITYDDGSPVKLVPSGSLARDTHDYLSPGSKTIRVRGRHLNSDYTSCNEMSQSFNALQTLLPGTIDALSVLSATQIQLELSTVPNVQYRLEISVNGSGSFQQLQTVHNQTTPLVINNLKTETSYYCFRLGTVDPCNNNTISSYSNTICSARFNVSAQDNVNNGSWTTSSTNVSNYAMHRNGAVVNSAISSGSNSYPDTDIVCKTDYCYQLETVYTNGSRSYSLEKCATAFSTTAPASIQNITAAVDQNGVTLEWTSDPSFNAVEHRIIRAPGGLIGTTPSSPYTDAAYNSDGAFCYQVVYQDACNNFSTSVIDACPIRLSATLDGDNSVALNWSAYAGWQNGVASYVVEKYNAEGVLLGSVNAGTNTTLTDDAGDLAVQVYVYVVKANASDTGLGQAVSNPVTIIKEPNLYYPTAFTPNDDNLNDIFKVFGQYITAFEMKILNRWGEVLYVTTNINEGWDGSYRGNKMPEGTYVFVAEITDLAGRTFNRSGSVHLIRKK